MSALRGVLALVLLMLVSALPVPGPSSAAEHHAEEHGGAAAAHHDADHHAPALSELLFPAINFSIYLFIVVRYVVPAMREYLRRRRADMVEAQADASAGLARAEQALAASKARFAALKSEAEGIRQDLFAVATRQAERLTAQAEESGVRRLADAALVAEQERRRALGSVRAELASAATALAEQRIRAAITPDDQRTFVEQFLKDATTR